MTDDRVLEVSLRPWWSSRAAEITRRFRPVTTVSLASLVAVVLTWRIDMAMAAAGAVGALLLSLALASRARGRPSTVLLEPDTLVVDGVRLPHAELGAGTIERIGDQNLVRVPRLNGPPLRIEVSSVEAGRNLVARLGVDLSARPLTVWVGSRFRDVPASIAMAVWFAAPFALGFFATFPSAWVLAWPLWLFAVVGLRAAPSRLRIGADAIEHRWLQVWVRRWAIRDVASVDHRLPTLTKSHRLRLALRSGVTVEVPLASGAARDTRVLELARTLIERIERAMSDAGAPAPVAFAEWNETLAYGTPQSWLAALRGEAHDYRVAGERFTRDELWRTLRDTRAGSADRGAAAVMLARHEGCRGELEAVADATVLPEVARCIRMALARDDANLLAILSQLRRPAVRVYVPDVATDTEVGQAATTRMPARRRVE